jgi:hypothetical protein
MTKESSEPITLLGLLECPFRKGFIEFEYQPGDTIGELRKKVASLWGSPVALGTELDTHNWHGGLTDRGLWVILCEDESGAYLTLSNKDLIPISPPKASNNVELPHISPNPDQRWNLPSGLIYDTDVEEAIFTRQAIEHNEPERHLSLGINREYQIPKDKMYAVKLMALVVITGG